MLTEATGDAIATACEAVQDAVEGQLTTKPVTYGAAGNLLSAGSLAAGATTSAVSTLGWRECHLFYSDSDTGSSAEVKVQLSPDGSSWFEPVEQPSLTVGASARTFVFYQKLAGVQQIRLRNADAVDLLSDVTASALGLS